MTKIRILATEDDVIHEEKLRMALDVLNYALIDVLSDPHKVIAMISATKPDVLLMDIDLGSDISGIDLVKSINELFDIPTVYITSFVEIEIFNQAKETRPVAYITKPYKIDELERAIELAVMQKQEQFHQSKDSIKKQLRDHLFIKDGPSLIKVLLSDIKYIEAYDKYCNIYTSEKKFIIKERLKSILQNLPDSSFCQVHRSYIINMDAIDSIRMDQNKILIGNKEIGISKSYKSVLLSRINALG